ncbi:hypothetical protein ACP70R_030046 [Stipagrostis hirtigluma subsp. patula]
MAIFPWLQRLPLRPCVLPSRRIRFAIKFERNLDPIWKRCGSWQLMACIDGIMVLQRQIAPYGGCGVRREFLSLFEALSVPNSRIRGITFSGQIQNAWRI